MGKHLNRIAIGRSFFKVMNVKKALALALVVGSPLSLALATVAASGIVLILATVAAGYGAFYSFGAFLLFGPPFSTLAALLGGLAALTGIGGLSLLVGGLHGMERTLF